MKAASLFFAVAVATTSLACSDAGFSTEVADYRSDEAGITIEPVIMAGSRREGFVFVEPISEIAQRIGMIDAQGAVTTIATEYGTVVGLPIVHEGVVYVPFAYRDFVDGSAGLHRFDPTTGASLGTLGPSAVLLGRAQALFECGGLLYAKGSVGSGGYSLQLVGSNAITEVRRFHLPYQQFRCINDEVWSWSHDSEVVERFQGAVELPYVTAPKAGNPEPNPNPFVFGGKAFASPLALAPQLPWFSEPVGEFEGRYYFVAGREIWRAREGAAEVIATLRALTGGVVRAGNRLYLSVYDSPNEGIAVFDPSTATLKLLATERSPWDMFASGTTVAYCAKGADKLMIIEANDIPTVAATIPCTTVRGFIGRTVVVQHERTLRSVTLAP